jgi:hypothetical protein
MSEDRIQLNRFELKYVVSEATARAVRQFVRCYLQPDEFAANLPNYSYPVHSLYLDSPELTTYHAVQSGEKNRFKLRLRYYSKSDKAVYFEIKRRTNEVISKMRAKVHRAAVQPLLDGRPPQMAHLVNPSGKQFYALQEFCRLMHTLRAVPVSHVGYQREAWMSTIDNSMRITFDRAVQCAPEFGTTLHTQFGDAVTPFERNVILELKFTNRLPGWCGEMIRALGLVRGGAPKYAFGVYLMGEHRVSNNGVGIKVPETYTVPATPVIPAVPARPAPTWAQGAATAAPF